MALEEIKLWAMDGSGGAMQLQTAQQTDTEQKLEDALVKNPEMLMPGLTLVGRQTPTEGGPLDLLGVDEDGRLVVFELKRGTLSRDAVAQVIDYASFLDAKPEPDLVNFISEKARLHGVGKLADFEEWYGHEFGQSESASLKPVRTVLVGLGVDERTTRMVQFLANGGIDISLLTFLGFRHAGETLLARQVRVEASEEAERKPRSREGRLGRRKRGDLLQQRIDEHTSEWPEARDLWDAVLQMFRENFPGAEEIAAGGNTDWSRHRLRLKLPGVKRGGAAIQLGPFGIHPELVMPIFHRSTVNSCLPDFVQIRRELPEYWTYPTHRRDVEASDVDVGFPVKSLAEWDERKDRLAALTRSVYDSIYGSALYDSEDK